MMIKTKFDAKTERDLYYWKNKEVAKNVEEAKALAAEVKNNLGKPSITKFLIDNSDINEVTVPEVNEVWSELMGWVAQNVEKNAVVAPNVTVKMQINRLSRAAGTYEKVRAFTSKDEALEFLGSNYNV